MSKLILLSITIALYLPLAASAQAQNIIFEEATRQQSLFLATLKTLVNLDSGSDDGEGLKRVEEVLVNRLLQLGAKVELRPAKPSPTNANTIIGHIAGHGQKNILLMIHYDTVFARGEANRRPFHIKDGRAMGPGVADAKGGIAMILHTLHLLDKLHSKPYGKLTILFNPDEEKSSIGSRDAVREMASQQDFVLSFEPPEEDKVAVSTKGIAFVHLQVTGLASHAGSAPEKGRNAIMELAHQLLRLDTLGNPAKGTTVNWTVLQSGDKVNIIPDFAKATADMRMSDPHEAERVQRDAEHIVQNHFISGTEVSVRVEPRRPPFVRNPQSENLAKLANEIYNELGKSIAPVEMRFGTDAGFAYNPQSDKPAVLETMGIIGDRLHSADEFADVNCIPRRLYLAVRMIQELSAR